MSALTLSGPLVVAAGRSLAPPWWLATLAVCIVTLLARLLFIYGPLASLVGVLLTIVFVVTLGMDGGPATALPSALGVLLGGAVVLVLLLASVFPALLWERADHTAAPPSVPASARGRSWSLLTRLAHLDVRSPLFRQTLLRAFGAGGAAALAWKIGTPYPQWAPVVVIACVQPERATSVRAAVQNSIGTVLGVLLADLLIDSAQPPLVVALIVVVVVFIAFTVKDLNYALFTFFMTNLTLLLIHLSSPGVSPIRLRVFSVLVGSGIALAITFLDQWLAVRRLTRSSSPPDGPAAAQAP